MVVSYARLVTDQSVIGNSILSLINKKLRMILLIYFLEYIYIGETYFLQKVLEKVKKIQMSYSFICLIILGVATGLTYGKVTRVIFVSLFVSFVLGGTPNWIGTFEVNPRCDQTVCCCLSGEVQVKEVAHFFMTISGNLQGQCKGLPMFFLPALKPSTFSTKLPVIGVVNLSEDSSTLTAESPLGPECNGMAVRSEY